MIGATDRAGWNGLHPLSPRSGQAVIAIDHVEKFRRYFGQQDRTRQICRTNGFFIQIRAAIIRKFSDRDKLDWESIGASVDERQKSGNVKLEDSILVVFIARFGRTRLKVFVAF